MPREAGGNARARAEQLIARIAADLDQPLTSAILAAAITEVTDAIEHDLAADDIESIQLRSRLNRSLHSLKM